MLYYFLFDKFVNFSKSLERISKFKKLCIMYFMYLYQNLIYIKTVNSSKYVLFNINIIQYTYKYNN